MDLVLTLIQPNKLHMYLLENLGNFNIAHFRILKNYWKLIDIIITLWIWIFCFCLAVMDLCCYAASVMSDSVRPHRRQPTRLLFPWDSPGKNTGVGCHFLLQCIKVKSESEVVQSCLTLSDPMYCSLPGSSVHGIFQTRVLEWDAIAFSRTGSW